MRCLPRARGYAESSNVLGALPERGSRRGRGMRLAAVIFLSSVLAANAQTIATRVLTPGAPIKINLSPELTTTLLFPSPLSGTFGLGPVTSNNSNAGGTVQVEHPEGSNLLVLRALSEASRVLATVLLDGQLYVLDLSSGLQPDIAVTLVKGDAAAPRALEVTPEEIKAARLKYDPELFVGFERRARDAVLLKPLYPDLYRGYSVRQTDYTSDSTVVKTTVKTIHRFSKEDALVLEGTVQNETAHPITFDGRAATVLVANETHPVKLLDCLRPIPGGATVPLMLCSKATSTAGAQTSQSITRCGLSCRRSPVKERCGITKMGGTEARSRSLMRLISIRFRLHKWISQRRGSRETTFTILLSRSRRDPYCDFHRAW